jgi:hypothetical protein
MAIREQLPIGKVFGQLTLVEDLGMVSNKKGTRKYRTGRFKCDCGRPDMINKTWRHVKTGLTTSCGKCRYFEDPDNYGLTTTECEVCGKKIETRKNRVRDGRGRFCSQKCLFAKREIDMIKANTGFKHPKGKLTVVSFYKHKTQLDSNGNPQWFVKCNCDCGMTHEVDWISIQAGRVTRCSRCAGEAQSAAMNRLSELIGKKYGRLTVVGYNYVPGNNGENSHYLCDCECGTKNHPVRSAHTLESGHTKSCGCLEGHARDTFSYFKKHRDHRKRNCEFYFVEVAGGPIQKLGIAESTNRRGQPSYGNYTKKYWIVRTLNRAECWVLEQQLLYETLDHFPDRVTVQNAGLAEGYLGGTELRMNLKPEVWIPVIEEYEQEILRTSWRKFYERHLRSHLRDFHSQQLRKAIASGLLPDKFNDGNDDPMKFWKPKGKGRPPVR